MSLQEVNVSWSKLTIRHQWNTKSIGWWEGGNTSATSYNQNDISSASFQPGDFMLISTGEIKIHII